MKKMFANTKLISFFFILILIVTSIGVINKDDRFDGALTGLQINHRIVSSADGVVTVDDEGDGDFRFVQSAINYASVGDTIEVYSGTYYENIIITKKINLKGIDRELLNGDDKGKPVLDGKGNRFVVKVNADYVNISGLTIQNSGLEGSWEEVDAGIWLRNSNYNNIYNNYLTNNLDGIYIDNSSNNLVIDNTFYSNDWNGIDIYKCSGNIVRNNSFYHDGLMAFDTHDNFFCNNTVNDKPLIYLENEKNKIIQPNAGQVILINCENVTVQTQEIKNVNVGIILYNTSNTKLKDNKIENVKWYGILLAYSNNNTIINNTLNNINIGIYLRFLSQYNLVLNNIISKNPFEGMYLIEHSDYNIIRENTIFDSKFGALLGSDSLDNVIYENRFLNNTVNAWDAGSNHWDNGSIGNWWHDYYGEDLNHDGIGDIAYEVEPKNIPPENKDRYPTGKFQSETDDQIPPYIEIIKPREGFIYLLGIEAGKTEDHPFINFLYGDTIVFGRMPVQIDASDKESGINFVKVVIDGNIKYVISDPASSGFYEWEWNEHISPIGEHLHSVVIEATDKAGNTASSCVELWIWNL